MSDLGVDKKDKEITFQNMAIQHWVNRPMNAQQQYLAPSSSGLDQLITGQVNTPGRQVMTPQVKA